MKEFKNGSVKFDLSELNLLSIYASEAAKHYSLLNCPYAAEQAKEIADYLYNICDKHGLYGYCGINK